MTLDQLQAFVQVVQAGSFTRAAERLQTSKAHLSRVVAQLERELGAKLLERTTRALSVTETGREIQARAIAILGAVDDTLRVAEDAQREPRGVLRLTSGAEFGTIAVNGWIDEYLATYPQAVVDAEYTSRVIDLVHEGFDLAVRIGPLAESRLVARPLGTLCYGLFASPGYLARAAGPQVPDDLQHHALVRFSGGRQLGAWQLRRGREAVRVEAPARLRVNNSFAVRESLLRDTGIGPLPLRLAAEPLAQGRLCRVLPDWAPPPAPVHAVYPSSRYLQPKVRAFIDIAVANFAADAVDAVA